MPWLGAAFAAALFVAASTSASADAPAASPAFAPSSPASPSPPPNVPHTNVGTASNSRAIAEILVIHATKDDGGRFIDPRIGKLPNLGKKPFSEYTSFKLVDKKTLVLDKGRPESYAMVTGRTLRVTMQNVTTDRRYVVEASIDQPGKPEFLKLLEVTAAPNEPFFVGGQSHKGGTLILAITLH